jgi:hypothetical protein
LRLSAQKTLIARVSSHRAREIIWQIAAARIALCGCGSAASSGNLATPAPVKCDPSLRFKRDSKRIERGECAVQAVNTRGERAYLGCESVYRGIMRARLGPDWCRFFCVFTPKILRKGHSLASNRWLVECSFRRR